ncbi:MAG: DNA-3-methyladenine glycosylase I [Alphaproteobacteria bacterium]|nr:DNA-3-methyladenine glycosylase I [Alphaproteobacteria bacterium]MBV8548313.1 DNA-3-methyladenine glycosylase I [Alphaproteobacteria bacterium]
MSNYCKIAPDHPVHASYHNTEYGFPVDDDRVLFERLALEIMQAGLSWEIVLKKRQSLNKAFDRFSINKVAAYDERDMRRLLADEGIIRNRLKIRAIVHNAQVLKQVKKSHKSFALWIDAHHPRPKDDWVKLFKSTFSFMGGEIVGEFLMSIGYLPGAHAKTCEIYNHIHRLRPPWDRQ